MRQFENVLSDKGSRYAVSGLVVSNRADIDQAIKLLCRKKKFAKATHNTWGAVLADGTRLKNDDGESGAGLIILDILQREAVFDHLVIVTRWYGGVHLGADRFRHVRTCVHEYLSALGIKQAAIKTLD